VVRVSVVFAIFYKANMSGKLTEIEARIVGSLVEKQLTTPEYYPLTLNALVAACNQKTNREPVASYDEKTVTGALDDLRDKNIVYVFYGSTSRVPKYKHILPDVYELEPSETAVMCVLMLRGPQTIGELRERTGRLYDFRDLNDVNETLENLIKREDPLIVRLERAPGQKEARYAHLLCGEVTSYQPAERSVSRGAVNDERLEKLEQELENLRSELNSFRQEFDDFKKQFE
jgi:uncharacterized protein YceH (UPF0502 family)